MATWADLRLTVLTRAAGRCEECQVADGATVELRPKSESEKPKMAVADVLYTYTVVLQVLPYLDPHPRALCQACAKRLWITGAQLAGRPVSEP
jgi:hypothetical protein